MKKTNIFLLLISIALLATSCFKDLGNYDYTAQRTLEIKELEKNYSVISFLDHLIISPEITSDSKNLEYRWFVTIPDGMDKDRADTLSKEKVLDVPFEYKTGRYALHLKVTDAETGVAKYAVTTVSCTTPFMEGYYILKETADGNTEMDIHYPSGEVTENSIAKYSGAPLAGKPKTLSYMPEFMYMDPHSGERVTDYLMIPSSEDGRKTFRLSDMGIGRENDEWFYSPYPIGKIDHSLCIGFGYIMICEDGVHDSYQCAAWGMGSAGFFSDKPKLTAAGNSCRVTTNTCYVEAEGTMSAVFFNDLEKQLVTVDFNCEPKDCPLQYPPLTAGALPVVEPLKDKLLHIAGTKVDEARMYIVCEKEDGQRYFYYTVPSLAKADILKKADFKAGSGFDNADFYSSCRLGGNYLYAVSGNALFAFNPESEESQKLEFKGLPAGKITYFDTMYFNNEEEDSFNCFAIGTEADGKYTLSLYNMIGGLPVVGEGPVKAFSGNGKLKTFQYANPIKTSGANFMGPTYSLHY